MDHTDDKLTTGTDKAFVAGTQRARSPAETLARYAPCMERLGITRLANIAGLDVIGLPVYAAIRPNARGLATSLGKGIDAASAKVSALMESIETWHSERLALPMRVESYLALREDELVVDVTALPRRRGGILRLDAPMAFVLGRDLVQQRPIWIPYDCVSTNFMGPRRLDEPFALSTNGLASGNHFIEATVHAVCELIERDAAALWRRRTPAEQKAAQLDLRTVDDEYCRRVLERLEAADVGVAAWDLTSDVGVPVYSAAIFERRERPRWRPMGIFSGDGCHLSPGVALLRALTEAIQSRAAMISGSRDDLFYREYATVTNEDDRRAFAESVKSPAAILDFGARASNATPTFQGDLDLVRARLEAVGIGTIAVADLTHPELRIPVVRGVIPGIEGLGLLDSSVSNRRRAPAREVFA